MGDTGSTASTQGRSRDIYGAEGPSTISGPAPRRNELRAYTPTRDAYRCPLRRMNEHNR